MHDIMHISSVLAHLHHVGSLIFEPIFLLTE